MRKLNSLVAKFLLNVWNSDDALFILVAPLGVTLALLIIFFPMLGFVISLDYPSFAYFLIVFGVFSLIVLMRMIYLHHLKFRKI